MWEARQTEMCTGDVVNRRFQLKSIGFGVTLMMLSWAIVAQAASPAEIDEAIRAGVKLLYESQQNDNWDRFGKNDPPPKDLQFTGRTALAVFALLSAGERQTNPQLAAAVEWLKNHETRGTYALGMRAQVWNMIPHDREDIKALIRKESALLTPRVKDPKLARINPFRGLYYYGADDDSAWDNSCSQYGVLGVWALEQAGADISFNYWKAVESAWIANQSAENGGWQYMGTGNSSTINMTAAGVATLFITQEYLRLNDGIRCVGNADYKAIDRGLAWIQANLPKELRKQTVDPYGLYGIERIGTASGYKYFGSINWYDAGADELLRTRTEYGWSYREPSIANSFAILFLTRGRFPVAINKLQYSTIAQPQTRPATRPGESPEANWNQRPRDIANVTRFMGNQIERDLNWQIVDFNAIGEDFHDAPILYLSGSQALNLPPRDEARLKQFVEEGGLILGHADCANESFSNSFKSLGSRLFPAAGGFRPIEDDHPIYTRQQFMRKSWKNKPDLLGLSNGVRELMLLIPGGDPGKLWQQNDPKLNPEQFQLMSNIFLYSVDRKNLRFKGANYLVYRDPQAITKQTAFVARLMVGSNPDPEPGGWQRLANVLHNGYAVDLETRPVSIDSGELASFRIAHLTGTGSLSMTEAQRDMLKAFIVRGGTLIVDAAGGNTPFAESAEAELRKIFPDEAGQLDKPLPDNHPLFSERGNSIGRVAFRQFCIGTIPQTQTSPLLRGITFNQRLAVIFSREDLSAGLVGQPIDGIYGYTTDSATALMRNAILFAVGEPPKPPPPPPSTMPDPGGLLGGLEALPPQPQENPQR